MYNKLLIYKLSCYILLTTPLFLPCIYFLPLSLLSFKPIMNLYPCFQPDGLSILK